MWPQLVHQATKKVKELRRFYFLDQIEETFFCHI